MHREIREQPLQRSLIAYLAYGLPQSERWREQSMGDCLWHHIIDAHDDPQRTPRGAVLECVHQVASKTEYFIGVSVDKATDFRWNKRATGFREQFLSKTCFESSQLCADRRGRQYYFLTRAGEASSADDGPEVE
jgi:hypothetical protein